MALELVGGALLSATFQSLFERLASHDITDYFSSRKFKDDLLKNLRIKLISIKKVVEDAEKKQFQDPYVKQWLDELKDAVYEADDLLDDIAIGAARQKEEAESGATTSKKVRNFLDSLVNSFDREAESRIKKVLDNFEFLAKQKYDLGLQEGISAGGDYGVGGKWSKRLPTTSLVDESSIYGRNGDKEKVTKFLLSEDEGERQLSIISIIAMGGMGKTTLAQFVYNEERMNDEFQLKAWVCVSEEFDVVNVTKAIMRAFHISVNDSKDFNLLQLELKERLMGKRFLLFLDDVWDENHSNWEVLLVPFYTGAPRSKILVTTRSKNVASAMHSTQIYNLQKLDEEDSWKLFTKYAFNDSNVGTNPDLETVGRKIVKKCKGLPLAVKTVGSLLHTQLPYQEWVKILESEFWDLPVNKSDIIPALRLSYYYLPSNLKRCFAYCSTFPKDFEIKKDVLIQLWMAEGLLQSCQRDNCAEELGNEFFDELESRSFFQQSQGDGQHFIMHDLLNDLAKFVSGELCFRLEGDGVQDIAKRARHFSYQPKMYASLGIFKPLINCHQLRSFIPHFNIYSWKGQPVRYININLIHDLVSRFKYLRVLSLSGYRNLFELGDDIGNLKHLRSLDLSLTHINKLPCSICTIVNLQTLKLNGCRRLIELPSDLHKLINLHHLEFYESGIRKLSINIERLNYLRTLTAFSVSKHSVCNIKEIGKLKHLQGRLSILELENVIDPMDAIEAKMKEKINLDELEFGWNKDTEDSEIERRVLDALQPHSNLKKLTITGYGGTRFPDWLGPHDLFNLSSLNLRGSKHCFILPPLGQLPFLKELSISGFHAIVDIGNEFYGDNSSTTLPFRSLQKLKFVNMEEWKEWLFFNCDNEDEYFPCLKKLLIKNCPKLRRALPRCLPSLRTLVICDCPLLEAALPKAVTLEYLELNEDGNLSGSHGNRSFLDQLVFTEGYVEELGFAHSLGDLLFCGGHSCMPFSLDLFPNLCILRLQNCHELVTFPDVGTAAPKLNGLYLVDLRNLKSLPENMHTLLPSIKFLYLRGCKQLESFPQGGLPLSIVSLDIYDCPKLIASRMKWGLQNLHSLSSFSISDDFENVESFPEEGLLPLNVKRLGLTRCSKLKSINYKGLRHLKSLHSLKICDFPSLQCMPEEGLPKSLSELQITCSPLLELRCQREKGEDWHKISHIPHILIGENLMT